MPRSSVRVFRSSLVAFGIIALIPTSSAGSKVPVPRIVQPPDRFFQEGSDLAVVWGTTERTTVRASVARICRFSWS
jgi:hypothetical protein